MALSGVLLAMNTTAVKGEPMKKMRPILSRMTGSVGMVHDKFEVCAQHTTCMALRVSPSELAMHGVFCRRLGRGEETKNGGREKEAPVPCVLVVVAVLVTAVVASGPKAAKPAYGTRLRDCRT